jgi:tryptophan halogenase
MTGTRSPTVPPTAVSRTVVIVGGGTAGWMTAAALARFLPPGWTVRLIESDAIGTVGVGEATIPQLRLFNQGLGIDEDQFVRETAGTFKLGIEFAGWSGGDSRYVHAFGTIGRAAGLVPFHHHWLAANDGSSLWNHSASAQAAAANRFARDLGRPELPSGVAWAFHFDAGLYAAFLRRYAEARRVVRTEGRIGHVERGPAGIAAVVLDDGQRIAGDLFVDCSGFRGLLIEEALGSGYDDWSDHLPCDRALAVPSERTGALLPYTRATARSAGWQWRIPLQHRTGNGLVYSSRHLSDDEAAATLLAGLDGRALGDPRPLRFVTGRRRRAWVGNCVALGLAAGFMEPLESTSIHLVQSGIARLLEFWPGDLIRDADVAAFNRLTEAEWIGIRDFLILHYHANGRDEPFWAERRVAPIPDSLADRIALFRGSGRIVGDPDALFTEVAWLQVMIGQGIVPHGHHGLADTLGPADRAAFLDLSRRHAAAVAGRMPDHAAYVAAHCATPLQQDHAA